MEDRKKTLEAFGELIEVVEALRGENGCPWDREQTHESLRPRMLEEAKEAADAMAQYERNGESGNLKEELGDVLFQVLMNSIIAEEEGIFTLTDVIERLTRKMRHRHPHVFNRGEWEQMEHKKTWEELKQEEKEWEA